MRICTGLIEKLVGPTLIIHDFRARESWAVLQPLREGSMGPNSWLYPLHLQQMSLKNQIPALLNRDLSG